jgi:hypothetical protein
VLSRRLAVALAAAGLAIGGAAFAPAQAAPSGPQCSSIRNCDPLPEQVREKVQRVIDTCKYAYCQLP